LIWKVPPKIKIYEAISAIVDGRVKFSLGKEWIVVTPENINKIDFPTSGIAKVTSSNKEKEYTVKWNFSISYITSDDNGSKWQGYLGYPSIAILMIGHILPYPSQVASYLKGINWNRLNKKFKRDYDTVEKYVLLSIEKDHPKEALDIKKSIDEIYNKIKELKLKNTTTINF